MQIIKNHELDLLQSDKFKQVIIEEGKQEEIDSEREMILREIKSISSRYKSKSEGKHHIYRKFGEDISLITEVLLKD